MSTSVNVSNSNTRKKWSGEVALVCDGKAQRQTYEIEPCVGGEDLVLLVDVDDLLKGQAELDDDRIGFFGHRTLQRVVIVQ